MKLFISIKKSIITLALVFWHVLSIITKPLKVNNVLSFWRVMFVILIACAISTTSSLVYLTYLQKIERYGNRERNSWLSENVYSSTSSSDKYYTICKKNGEKTIKNIDWFTEPKENEDLVVFCQGGKRGYFNKETGEIAITPIYKKAWIFSEGLAGVVKGDSLYFINHKGSTLLRYRYNNNYSEQSEENEAYCFHEGLCVMYNSDNKYGVIDKTGKWIITPEYDVIYSYRQKLNIFILKKDDKYGYADYNGKIVSPCQYSYLEVSDKKIFVSLDDNTQRQLNNDGTLTNEFLCYSVEQLSYNTGFQTNQDGEKVTTSEYAELLSYTERSGYMGLIDKKGNIITRPIYLSIKAMDKNLYRCGYDSELDNSVLINGKGEIVKVK